MFLQSVQTKKTTVYIPTNVMSLQCAQPRKSLYIFHCDVHAKCTDTKFNVYLLTNVISMQSVQNKESQYVSS